MPDFMTLEMDWHQFGRRLYGSGLGLDYGTETILYMQTYNRAIVINSRIVCLHTLSYKHVSY